MHLQDKQRGPMGPISWCLLPKADASATSYIPGGRGHRRRSGAIEMSASCIACTMNLSGRQTSLCQFVALGVHGSPGKADMEG